MLTFIKWCLNWKVNLIMGHYDSLYFLMLSQSCILEENPFFSNTAIYSILMLCLDSLKSFFFFFFTSQ